ncbi:piggyBac transposable element-derived protein 4-like [Bradysia coprophila]|uniref:piggyBac transposable element-derived protein 4-like n=1 Tax=Bradysia coprophila TaxID=38358 RepID=UPI00187DA72C|nr:piggyBac transposable element-derived protein 4-like [Bradysia coprophila]
MTTEDDFYGFSDQGNDIFDECSSDEEHHESICLDSSDEEDTDTEDAMSDWSDLNDSETSDDDTKETSKDGTKWAKVPYKSTNLNYKNTFSNISAHQVNLPPDAVIKNPEDAFFLYFNDFIITEIVKYTNIEAENHTENWKPVDVIEMRAFFGLLLTAGHLKQNNTNYITLWSVKYGSPIFRATMSLVRFKLLLRFIRFDDKATRSIRRATDKLAPIRDIFEECNKMFAKFYIPGHFLTVDEQMIGWRGRCPFMQFMPKKPDKYGMKMFWICDAKTAYPLSAIPYLGKEGNERAKAGLGERIVLKLCEPYFQSNRHVTYDNFFGSLDLAKTLLNNKLTSLTTVKKNKRFVPASFQPNKLRTIHSSIFGFKKKATLVSYVPKRSKAVILLSTMHSSVDIVDTEHKKPKMILDYNNTKGGVDTFDQMIHEYSSKRKTNRWPLSYFFNLMDASALAAYNIWITTNHSWKTQVADRRCQFLKTLCENLVTPLIARRMKNLVGVCLETKAAMDLFLPSAINNDKPKLGSEEPKTNEKSKPEGSGQKRRCRFCPYSIGRRQKQQCGRCEVNVCNSHCTKTIICQKCLN